MAKNDQLLIDGIIDERVSLRLPSDRRDETFEYLAFEQILKDLDFSSDEIKSGSIDGRGDGGIDGFYIVVNGHLLQDIDSFVWPKTGTDLRLTLITCKHHDTFKQATLDNLVATLTELLNFAIDDASLIGAYSATLLKMRNNLKFAYRKLSPRLSSFTVNIYYASRGDTAEIGHEVAARGAQIKALVKDCFGSCNADFIFLGAGEIVALHRKLPNYTLELPFLDSLSKGEQYALLVRLSDYFSFISDAVGGLRRYLFESNVRDFMGLNRVNEDIKTTLDNIDSPDFWWLNNGVTILASTANITGKSIQATDIQIVNGLQTTESIYRHFKDRSHLKDDRCVLIKVFVSNNQLVSDAIIRATNNQTTVELASLHATDKIQRDIEEIMLRHELFYERRKNYYVNQGHSPAELVTPLYAASGFVALVLKKPHNAVALRSKFMRSPDSYEAVFSKSTPLEVWPKLIHILKRVDLELETLRPTDKPTDRFLKGWRYIVAFILISEEFKSFAYSVKDLISYDDSKITHAAVKSVWNALNDMEELSQRAFGWSSHKCVLNACEKIGADRGISHAQCLGSAKFIEKTKSVDAKPRIRKPITDEFVENVRKLLPLQPWKPGLHRLICEELKCSKHEYSTAVDKLIGDGIFLRQKNGVVFDPQGNVVSFDADRVDPATLQIRPDRE